MNPLSSFLGRLPEARVQSHWRYLQRPSASGCLERANPRSSVMANDEITLVQFQPNAAPMGNLPELGPMRRQQKTRSSKWSGSCQYALSKLTLDIPTL